MLPRGLTPHLKKAAQAYPVVTVTGPRQSGKTTLVRDIFPEHAYASLEAPDRREFAQSDPRGFLRQFSGGVVLDEVQQVPELLSYVQEIVDEEKQPGRFVLTGSQNLLLLDRVSQSLAGRAAVFHLLPFTLAELRQRVSMVPEDVGTALPSESAEAGAFAPHLLAGFYPPIHDRGLDAHDWLRSYYQTYIERDVRSIVNIGDFDAFGRFVRLCAGRCGQLLNLSSLGADCGVSHTTARRWLSVLEATFIVYLLRPHHRNFSKRLIKSPKLYFVDTGLLCYLLRIRSAEELALHSSRGAVFESFAVSELLKGYLHAGREPDMYFWRDIAGHEIDVVLDHGSRLVPIEIKSGETIVSDFFAGLEFWRSLPDQQGVSGALVYGGPDSRKQGNHIVYSWSQWL